MPGIEMPNPESDKEQKLREAIEAMEAHPEAKLKSPEGGRKGTEWEEEQRIRKMLLEQGRSPQEIEEEITVLKRGAEREKARKILEETLEQRREQKH